MMKYSWTRALGGVGLLFVLVSCGGGGDIAGDSSEFAVFPTKVSWKDTEVRTENTTACVGVAGAQAIFTIVGGQAPFRIVNTFPEYLRVDKTEATGKDPKFTVTLTGGCGDPLTILILDYHSKQAAVEIKVERESSTSTATQ